MSKITVSDCQMPLIEFDSDEWKSNDEYIDVANKIIKYIRKNDFEAYLIQNRSYSFGDTETHPIIMVLRGDYGGLKGTLELFIKDIIYDLIPEE
jgi:hypothetical protein